MEYVPGQSMAELLARQGRLAPHPAVELAIQVCAALAAAHVQGLVLVLLWPGGGDTPSGRGDAGSTRPAGTGPASTSELSSTATSAPSQSGVQAALASLTAVVNAARQEGSVDQEAEDLLHQADDLANALQEGDKGEGRNGDKGKDGEGKDEEKGREVGEKVTDLERKVKELIAKGKIRSPGHHPNPRGRRPAGPGRSPLHPCHRV